MQNAREMQNARDYDFYEDMGINLDTLGCVMLRVSSPLLDVLPGGDVEYISTHPDRYWINGATPEHKHHVTLRYGFLPEVKAEHVDQVLDRVSMPSQVNVGYLDIFPSPYEDEPYECLVARVHSDALERINKQLGILPNVQTFVDYKPHITIGYFKEGYFSDNHRELYRKLKLSVEVVDYYVGRSMRV